MSTRGREGECHEMSLGWEQELGRLPAAERPRRLWPRRAWTPPAEGRGRSPMRGGRASAVPEHRHWSRQAKRKQKAGAECSQGKGGRQERAMSRGPTSRKPFSGLFRVQQRKQRTAGHGGLAELSPGHIAGRHRAAEPSRAELS